MIRAMARGGDATKSVAEQLIALKFLTHFMGDIHQPLHVGFSSDRVSFVYCCLFNINV
jgi:hypothetical protein